MADECRRARRIDRRASVHHVLGKVRGRDPVRQSRRNRRGVSRSLEHRLWHWSRTTFDRPAQSAPFQAPPLVLEAAPESNIQREVQVEVPTDHEWPDDAGTPADEGAMRGCDVPAARESVVKQQNASIFNLRCY